MRRERLSNARAAGFWPKNGARAHSGYQQVETEGMAGPAVSHLDGKFRVRREAHVLHSWASLMRSVEGLLRRLARTSARELAFRGRERAHAAAEAVRYGAGRERWERDVLRARLLPSSPDLIEARAALARHDWRAAGAAMRRHFVSRTPRFTIEPARRDAFAADARRQFPGCAEDAARRADPLLQGRHDLLGYRDLSFGGNGSIDWHLDPAHQRRAPVKFWTRVPYLDPRSGDHKVIWEINRHQHWLALGRAAWLTGDRRYAAAAIRELESWLASNPPLAGINWASMLELGFRSISWIWALHLFAPMTDDAESEWIVDLLAGLDRQLEHVARHLSVYFSPNTHLLGEALALYVAGRALPELRGAARWESIGRETLLRESHAQVHDDGGHAELSTHYHRYALDFYLLALVVARRTGDPAAAQFEEVAGRMAEYCRAMAGDDGCLPTIGDDDGGLLFPICGRRPYDASDSLALAAVLLNRPGLAVGDAPEEVFWMTGGAPVGAAAPADSRDFASQWFPATGYAVIRRAGVRAILDAGRHGFMNAGHAHADALSVVLSIDGRALLIDPGTATYTMNADTRDRFRSTAMHNTVVVDGRPQSIPSGPFHWESRANARVHAWRPGPALTFVEAEHDGYLPVVHRRAVLTDGTVWLVADHVLGAGSHDAAAYWHFDPAWTLMPDAAGEARLAHRDGSFAAIASTAGGLRHFHGDDTGLGWCAPVYGQLVAAPTVRFSSAGEHAFSFVTAVAAAASPVRLSAELVGVEGGQEDGWQRVAAMVMRNDTRLLALFATPPASADAADEGRRDRAARLAPAVTRASCRVALSEGELTTDARAAMLRFDRSGVPVSLDLVDARAATWRPASGGDRSAFSVGPLAEAADLHLDGPELRRLGGGVNVRRVG